MKNIIENKKYLLILCVVVCLLIVLTVVFQTEKTDSSEAESTPLATDYTSTKAFVENIKHMIIDLESQQLEETEQKQKLLDTKERLQGFQPPKTFSDLHNELFSKYKNGMIQAIDKQLQNPTLDHSVLAKESEQAIAFWSVLEIYILEDLYLYNS